VSFIFPGAPEGRQAQAWRLLENGDADCLEFLWQEVLFPYIYFLLVQQGRQQAVSDLVLEKLRHEYLCAVQQAVMQEAEAARVVGELATAGLEVTLLKGADLRLRVYPDPATRPMTDLDLLVAPHDLARTRAVLESLGYCVIKAHVAQRSGFRERFAPADIYEPPPDLTLKVDLHWGLWHQYSFYGLPLAPIQAQALPAHFQGVPVKVLAPEHLLMHLSLHAYWDFVLIRQLVDLALTAATLPVEWSRLQAEASRWGCQAPVFQVLSLVRQLSPEVVPAAVLAGLAGHQDPWAEKLVHTETPSPLTYYFATLYRLPLGDWLPFLLAKLWPDREYLLANFGSDSRGHYLWQFVRKFKARGPEVD
jgi:hypothetical protein